MSNTDTVPFAIYLVLGVLVILVSLALIISLRRSKSSQYWKENDPRVFTLSMAHETSRLRQEQWETLTRREREVARLAAEGRRNAEIAQDLQISTHTVATHLKNIYSKLHVRSRLELAQVIREIDEQSSIL